MDIFAGDIEIDLPPDEEEDPHVRVVGDPEAVRLAGAMVRQFIPHSKITTLKMDVEWVYHSHLIGKGGNTIQPIVKRTGVSIHFPDGNKNSDIRKSNLVSINGRGDDLSGLEEARAFIRDLTPVVFTFILSASAQFINISDPNLLIQQVQSTYKVQVELKVTDDLTPMIVGSVRGDDHVKETVKEATLCILQAYCGTLAKQMPVQMSMEISPQHHSFVVGRNNENLKRIMQRTATKITFPDTKEAHPLRKSTVVISGAIDNVYLARQNIVGALPLVLMFEVDTIDECDIPRMSQVKIEVKQKRVDGRRLVICKGAEKNADNIYEAWRLISKADKEPPKARIPANYHVSEAAPLYGLSMNLGHWLGGSGNSSPTSTPAPPPLHSSSNWGVPTPPTSSQIPSPFPHSQYNTPPYDLNTTYYTNSYICNGSLDGYNNNSILPKSSGKSSFSSAINLNSFSGMVLSNSADVSCGTSSNSGSSISSPAQSPRDPSPDQIMGSQSSSQFGEMDSSSMGIKALSVMMTDMERRAPGCEKKRLELEHQKLTSLSDYNSKKLQAARAMKEQVTSNTSPRTPTSKWTGFGFSKSMPGFMMQEAKLQRNSHRGELENWEGWQSTEGENTDYPSCRGFSSVPYSTHLTQISANLGSSDGSLALQRPPVSLSASNFMDCVLPRPTKTTCSPVKRDITSVLTDIQLEQYIDVFAAQEVDLEMFVTLDDTDLKELGIKIFGHRKRILMVIKDLASKKPFYAANVTPVMDNPVLRDNSTLAWD